MQLFAERLAQMFNGTDPFFNVDSLVLKQEEADNKQQVTPVVKPTTPSPVLPKLPLALHVGESWNAASGAVAESSTSASNRNGFRSMYRLSVPRRGDGWYVAYHAVLPGVYCGVWVYFPLYMFEITLTCTPGKHSRPQVPSPEDFGARLTRNRQIRCFIG